MEMTLGEGTGSLPAPAVRSLAVTAPSPAMQRPSRILHLRRTLPLRHHEHDPLIYLSTFLQCVIPQSLAGSKCRFTPAMSPKRNVWRNIGVWKGARATCAAYPFLVTKLARCNCNIYAHDGTQNKAAPHTLPVLPCVSQCLGIAFRGLRT